MFEPYERETIINTNDTMDCWEIYTRQRKIISKLTKQGYDSVTVEMEDDKVVCAEFVISLSKISFRNAITKERVMSEEDKMKAAERMRNNRKNRVK